MRLPCVQASLVSKWVMITQLQTFYEQNHKVQEYGVQKNSKFSISITLVEHWSICHINLPQLLWICFFNIANDFKWTIQYACHIFKLQCWATSSLNFKHLKHITTAIKRCYSTGEALTTCFSDYINNFENFYINFVAFLIFPQNIKNLYTTRVISNSKMLTVFVSESSFSNSLCNSIFTSTTTMYFRFGSVVDRQCC